MNMKFPLFVAALSMMAHLLPLPASTLTREGMITTNDYATFLNTPEGEGGEISSFLAIEGAMHRQDCYEEKMAEEAGASCLMRMGEPGNYFYACTEGTSSTPLHFISTLDAELYCRWNNTALAPAATQSSKRDPLLKTNITTFQIQIAHEGTQGTSLHQAMGEEETVEPIISEILEEIISVVLAGGVLGGNNLHARAHERVPAHMHPELPISLRFAPSTREISEENHPIDNLEGIKNPRANLKNLMNIPNNPKSPSTSGMGDTNPTNTDAQPSLKMSPEKLEAYQLKTCGRKVEPVAHNPSLSIHEAVSPFASPEEGPLPFSAHNAESSALPLPALVPSEEPIEEVPGSENFADKNLFPDLVDNSSRSKASATSDQERFEEALEMIQGKGLCRYEFREGEEPVRVKARLDGRAMLRQLAEGKIEFPLTTPSLQNTSLEEIFHNIAFALNDNISEVDNKLADLKRTAADQDPPSKGVKNSINCLETYKKALETGNEVLLLENIPRHVDADFFSNRIRYLNTVFTLCEKAEEAIGLNDNVFNNFNNHAKDSLLALEQLENENHGRSYPGYAVPLARLRFGEELARPEPRADVLRGLNEVTNLWQRIENMMNTHDPIEARHLALQAHARLLFTEELEKPDPNRLIMSNYARMEHLCALAESARDAGNKNEANELHKKAQNYFYFVPF